MPESLVKRDANLQRRARLQVIVPGPTMFESLSRNGGVVFEEGLRLAGNRRMVSNKRLSEAAGCDEWDDICVGLPCWTGTIAACAAPGRPLGAFVEHNPHGIRWVLEVPVEFRKERGAALVVEQPDYYIELERMDRIICAKRIEMIPELAPGKEFCMPDPKHGIPCGPIVPADDAGARYLSREETFVGPIIRRIMHYFGSTKRRDISVELRCPDNGLGVIVETGDAPDAAQRPDKLLLQP